MYLAVGEGERLGSVAVGMGLALVMEDIAALRKDLRSERRQPAAIGRAQDARFIRRRAIRKAKRDY